MQDRTNLYYSETLFDSRNSELSNDYFWETQQTNSFRTQQGHLHQMLQVQEQIDNFLNNAPIAQPQLGYALTSMNRHNDFPPLYQVYPQYECIYPIDPPMQFHPNNQTPNSTIKPKQKPAAEFDLGPLQNLDRIHESRRSTSPGIQFSCSLSSGSESVTGRSTSSLKHQESRKRRRFVWSQELSEALGEAIEAIGCESATAKNVLSLMSQKVDVSSLTRIRVANHVQYYRNRKNKLLINSFKNETQ
eukprot:TRINITY_DN1073_c0_g1_i3.p1 TRINITY_DN1073_c0_g1~~TRINITY_DN1073_c0_g1_i3.p1  ORF type:complete len:246 (-),score=28.86 TRINITY_DN1073_c0_g1_i3:62-799(-)